MLVAYQIYRGPGNRYVQIPGVLGRSEYGLEIVTEIAYLVYIVGLSFDKVCQLLDFFQDLRLRKSQANTLLYQLSRDWEREFDALCTLLAHSLVVHADETRWSLNSVWAFLSEKARVLLFGVHKDAGTLQKVLDPTSFAGILISDDAAVYAHFTRSLVRTGSHRSTTIECSRDGEDHHGDCKPIPDRQPRRASRRARCVSVGDRGKTRISISASRTES